MSTLREAIAALEHLDDSIPDLDKHELESRLSDLENTAREIAEKAESLATAQVDELEDRADELSRKAESLADDINTLYNEV